EPGAGNPSKRSRRTPCTPASVSSVERHAGSRRRSSRPTPQQDLRKSVAVEGSRSLSVPPGRVDGRMIGQVASLMCQKTDESLPSARADMHVRPSPRAGTEAVLRSLRLRRQLFVYFALPPRDPGKEATGRASAQAVVLWGAVP